MAVQDITGWSLCPCMKVSLSHMCAQRTDPWRFGVRMGYKLRRHWRKSSQWFVLTRKHAELVMQDTELLPIFAQHCQNAWDNDLNRCSTPPSSCKPAFP